MARHEYWATCSIYDHRRPFFKKALLLFDRVVIPVPTRPVGDLKTQELRALERTASKLADAGAAVEVQWDPETFYEWRQEEMYRAAAEGLAARVNRDSVFDTRLHMIQQTPLLVRQVGVQEAVAVPVYRSRQDYEHTGDLQPGRDADMLLNLELQALLPQPSEDVALGEILDYRKNEVFRESIFQLHRWRDEVLPQLLRGELTVPQAMTEFDHWVRQYEEAVADAEWAGRKRVVVSVVAVGALAAAAVGATLATGGAAAPLLAAGAASPGVVNAGFLLREGKRPVWKQVRSEEFAPAGVVYEARNVLT